MRVPPFLRLIASYLAYIKMLNWMYKLLLLRSRIHDLTFDIHNLNLLCRIILDRIGCFASVLSAKWSHLTMEKLIINSSWHQNFGKR
jgi:hypothetical protein